MSVQKTAYLKYIEKNAKKSPIIVDSIKAFLVGGSICLIGQVLRNLYFVIGLSEDTVKALVPSSIVLITAIFTAIGVFDRIARFAGAGTLLPVTGFANAMVSPAMDARSEGYVMGVGNKLFTVCGPVIAYSVLASILYGAILFIVSLF